MVLHSLHEINDSLLRWIGKVDLLVNVEPKLLGVRLKLIAFELPADRALLSIVVERINEELFHASKWSFRCQKHW